MRKYTLLISFFFIFPAESKAGDLQSMYLDNYEKVSTVEVPEVFSRIQSPFSDTIEKEIVEGKLPEEFKENFSEYTKLQTEKNAYKNIFNFETSSLYFEENLTNELLKLPIYSNESESDAGFDLIKDLNDIDIILFGEQASKTNPHFSKPDSQAFVPEQDPWQIGDEAKRNESETLSVKTKTESNTDSIYDVSDASVSGNLESIRDDLVKLASKSLAAECTSKKIFEPPFVGKNLSNFGSSGILKYTKPRKPKHEPEVLENKKELIVDTFSALEKKIINEVPCEEKQKRIINDVGLGVVKNSINTCRMMKEQDFARDLEGIHKRAESISEKKHAYRISETLNMWHKHFSTFLTEVTQMRKFLEIISKKPVKY